MARDKTYNNIMSERLLQNLIVLIGIQSEPEYADFDWELTVENQHSKTEPTEIILTGIEIPDIGLDSDPSEKS